MEKTNVLIVEDEFIVAQDIKEALFAYGYEVSGMAVSYDDAVSQLSEFQPDIALLDVKLKGVKTGIDLGKYIREKYNFPLIFLTSFSDKKTIDEAKDCYPDAYLIKPFIDKELYSSIEIALNNFSSKIYEGEDFQTKNDFVLKDAIFIKKDLNYVKVKLNTILFIKSEGNYLELVEESKNKFIIRSSLKDFLRFLPDELFLRVHNSYVVNTNHITKISYSKVYLGEYEIPFSRSRKDLLMNKMNFFS